MSFHISTTRSALTVWHQIVEVVAIKTVVMIVFIILLMDKLGGKKNSQTG